MEAPRIKILTPLSLFSWPIFEAYHRHVLCDDWQQASENSQCKRECGKSISATTHRSELRRVNQVLLSGLRCFAASLLRLRLMEYSCIPRFTD